MDYDDFGSAGGDDNLREGIEGLQGSHPEECSMVDRMESEALETWLLENHGLLTMGLRLATMARQYKREYRHVPFNTIGWFSPN